MMATFRSAVCRATTCFIVLGVTVSCQSVNPPNERTPTAAKTATTAIAAIVSSQVRTAVVTASSPVPTFVQSQTPSASETPRGTATPSNLAILNLLLQTPQPVPPQLPQANETGITPGQTEAEVRAVLGDPKRVDQWAGMTVWTFGQGLTLPNRPAVYFSPKGIVQAVSFNTPGETAESIIAASGPPELVLIYVIPDPPTPPPGVTPAPLANPNGRLLYLSKGFYFSFGCSPYLHAWCLSVKYCTGVPREAAVYDKSYFAPTTLIEWSNALETPDAKYCIRPWTGFSD